MRANWSCLLRDYLESLRLRGLAPSTLVMTSHWCSRFAEFCRQDGAGSPAAATRHHPARWRRRLEDRRPTLAPATVYQALRMVKAWLAWACREGLLLTSPAADLVVKEPPLRPRRGLTEAEAERLLELPDLVSPIGLRDRAVLDVLYSAGLRAGECCRLDLSDLDLAERQLWVRRGKGGKDRLLPIGECLRETLGDWLVRGRPALLVAESREPALFLNQYGGRLDYQSLKLRVRHFMTRAGFSGARMPTSHSLRRSCATHMLRNGAELPHVAEFLGHAQLSTTEVYTKLDPIDLVREHERTHPRARRRESEHDERTHPRKVEQRRPGVLLCEENSPGGAP